MKRTYLAMALTVLAITMAACGGSDRTGDVVMDDSAGQGEPAGDVYDSDAARAEAKALLGLTDAELEPEVRVSRRGEEQMMLTEDYVLGRMTVELDINDMDQWIVTAVTVELPDGPVTFTQYLQ